MDPHSNSRSPTLVAQGNRIDMESSGDTIANQAGNHSLKPERRKGPFYKTLSETQLKVRNVLGLNPLFSFHYCVLFITS
jgi:hypothetical protein